MLVRKPEISKQSKRHQMLHTAPVTVTCPPPSLLPGLREKRVDFSEYRITELHLHCCPAVSLLGRILVLSERLWNLQDPCLPVNPCIDRLQRGMCDFEQPSHIQADWRMGELCMIDEGRKKQCGVQGRES